MKGKRDAPVADYYPQGNDYQHATVPQSTYGVPQHQQSHLAGHYQQQQHQQQPQQFHYQQPLQHHSHQETAPQSAYGLPNVHIQQPHATYGPPATVGIKYSTPQVVHSAPDFSYLAQQLNQPQSQYNVQPNHYSSEQGHGGATYYIDNSGSDLQSTLSKYFGGHNSLVGGYSDNNFGSGAGHYSNGLTYSGGYKANLAGHDLKSYKLKVSPIIYEAKQTTPIHANGFSHHNLLSSSYELPLSQSHSSFGQYMSYAPSMSYGAPATHNYHSQTFRQSSNIPSYAHGVKGLRHYSTANIEVPAPSYKLPAATYGTPFTPGKPLSFDSYGKHNALDTTLHTSYIGTHPSVSFKPSTFLGLSHRELPSTDSYHNYQAPSQEYGVPSKALYVAPTKAYLPPVSQPQNSYLPPSTSHHQHHHQQETTGPQVTNSYLPPVHNTQHVSSPAATTSYLPPDNSYLPPHQAPSTSYGTPNYNTIHYSSPTGGASSASASSSSHNKY